MTNLPFSITEEEFRALFSANYVVVSVSLVRYCREESGRKRIIEKGRLI